MWIKTGLMENLFFNWFLSLQGFKEISDSLAGRIGIVEFLSIFPKREKSNQSII